MQLCPGVAPPQARLILSAGAEAPASKVRPAGIVEILTHCKSPLHSYWLVQGMDWRIERVLGLEYFQNWHQLK